MRRVKNIWIGVYNGKKGVGIRIEGCREQRNRRIEEIPFVTWLFYVWLSPKLGVAQAFSFSWAGSERKFLGKNLTNKFLWNRHSIDLQTEKSQNPGILIWISRIWARENREGIRADKIGSTTQIRWGFLPPLSPFSLLVYGCGASSSHTQTNISLYPLSVMYLNKCFIYFVLFCWVSFPFSW